MKKQSWKPYVLFVLLAEAVGVLAGWLTRGGTELYSEGFIKPPLSPPAIVFPIVWTVLYALMGIGVARVWLAPESDDRTKSLFYFFAQLAANFVWSLIFFNLQNFGFAFVWLVLLCALILGMILSFQKVDPTAARLQIPYLLWVTFAAYLNLGIWLLNR